MSDDLLSRRNVNGTNDDEDVYVSSGYMDPSSFLSQTKVKVNLFIKLPVVICLAKS